MTLNELPAIGQPLDAGLFAGITTTAAGQHHAVVLLPAKPDTRLNWGDAKTWAETAGGTLPTRPVAALLYANVAGEFEEAWHWTADEDKDDGSCAWDQNFGFGGQNDFRKSYEGRARAVRLIPLTA